MSTLWVKFPEEAFLPQRMTAWHQAALTAFFNANHPDSAWCWSVKHLGLRPLKAGTDVLQFYEGRPYINWSAMVQTVSCGWLRIVRKGNVYGYRLSLNPLNLVPLLRGQWKISMVVEDIKKNPPVPAQPEEKIRESIMLGLALQSLMLRLPKEAKGHMAAWLRDPKTAPSRARKTLSEMELLQKRRTEVSDGWAAFFPEEGEDPSGRVLPEFFWDAPPESLPEEKAPVIKTDHWQGTGISGQNVTAPVVIMRPQMTLPSLSEKPILVFAQARPDTVDYFDQAAGILYAEGGAMSHACTVARERGIPCITALGAEFITALEACERPVLTLDIKGGFVRIAPNR